MSVNPDQYFKYFKDTLSDNLTLDELESRISICTIHRCVNKLLIILKMATGFKEIEYFGYKTLAFRTKYKNKIQSEEIISDKGLQLQRIYRYISYTINVLKDTIGEINFLRTHGFLQNFLCCENFKRYDEITLREEYNKNAELFQFLNNKTVSYTSNASNIQTYLLDTAVPCLNQAEINLWAQLKTFGNYNTEKENTKIEQNLLQLQEKQNALQKTIDKLIYDCDEDMKIHMEVEGHLSIVYTEMVEKFGYWSDRYSTEIDKLDVELLQMRGKSEEQAKLLEKKQEEVKTKGELIKQLQAEADKRDKEQQQKIKENKAASVIQLWWRNKVFWRKIKILRNNKELLKSNRVKTKTKNLKKPN